MSEAKRIPPQNIIVPHRVRDKWDHQLDTMVARTRDMRSNNAELLALTTTTHNEVRSLSRWSWVRDIVIVILLVLILTFQIWRAWLSEDRLHGCATQGGAVITLPKHL